MEYRITKDCGTGWGNPSAVTEIEWGISDSQRQLALTVEEGDTLLHYIDYANVWAGYSTVTGRMQPNNGDTDAATRDAFPNTIKIKGEVWLNAGQCQRTASISGLSHPNHHRQNVFTRIPPADAELIIATIKAAAAADEPALSVDFMGRWKSGAEGYYKGIVKNLARGICWLCKTNAAAWLADRGIDLPAPEVEKIRAGFLDAAHIKAHSKGGLMEPDNLRALCPNCHRMVDRLTPEQRGVLLAENPPN